MRPLAVAAFAFLAASAFAPPASAEPESAEQTARRMADRLFFVRELETGWRPLLEDVRTSVDRLPRERATPVRAVRDEAADEYVQRKLRVSDAASQDEAYSWLKVLAEDAVLEARRRGYGERAADIDVVRADEHVRAGRVREARTRLLDGQRLAPGYAKVLDPLTDLLLRLAGDLAADGKEDFEGALLELDVGTADVPAGSPWAARLDAERTGIFARTGLVVVEWVGDLQQLLAVQGARTDFREAQLEFTPAESGARVPPPQSLAPDRRIRVRRGTYALVARGPGGVRQKTSEIVVGEKDAVARLVPVLPDGMVLVDVPELPWFLIDRTEVSAADYRRVMERPAGPGERLPAAGVSFSEAKQYAELSRKALPTEAQWKAAAFGTPRPAETVAEKRACPYPWGSRTAELNRHFVGGRSSPGPVDGCQDGKSKFDVLNMAGNVWEWLDTGWLIGGGWDETELRGEWPDAAARNQEFHYLHDPLPTDEIHRNLKNPQEKSKYDTYRAGPNTLPMAGLRCVISLGTTRRP